MPGDIYFNQIGMQLIKLPAASRQALLEASVAPPRDSPFPPPFAVFQSRSWAEDILQEPFQPPASAPFLPFPKEDGVCDVVRTLYRVEGWELQIAQSKYMISIRVDAPPIPPGPSELMTAMGVARRILVMSDRMRFILAGAFGSGKYGLQDPGNPVDGDWPHWLDELRWWNEAPNVGFLTLKASGGPTKSVLSVAEDRNRQWFG